MVRPNHKLLSRITIGVWLLTLLGAGLYLVFYSGLLPERARHLQLNNIRHEIGHAYLGQLSTSEYSSHLSPSPGVLREDNKPLGPANALHDDIRKLGGGRFSLWHGHVYFSTSDDTDPRSNGRSYQVVAPYFGHQSALLLKYGTLLLGLAALLLTLLLVARYPDSHARLVRFIWLLLRLVPLALGLGLLLYLLSALYALGKGESLYLAWPLARLNLPFFVEQVESRLPALLVDWAIAAWLFSFLASNSAQEPLAQRAKSSLSFWYTWLGLPAVIGLFALHTGAIWYAPESMHSYAIGSSLAGIVPFSDAKGHFQMNQMFAGTGEFHFWLMRRPLAAALRVGLEWLGGYNPFHVLGLQVVLLGSSVWLLGLTLLRRWGVFAAICAVALVMTYARNFQATYLVHALGVAWSCLSMALLVEFLYLRRLGPYLVGLGSLTVALLVRMGAMFLPPALALWLAWTHRRNGKKALALLAGHASQLVCAKHPQWWRGNKLSKASHAPPSPLLP